MRFVIAIAVLGGCSTAAPATPAHDPPTTTARPVAIVAPPPEVVAALGLSPRYVKHVAVQGFAIVGSARVSDHAIREAAFLVDKMIGHRPEILAAMTAHRVRLVVMAPSEMTTDVPEHADLEPKAYWDRRARGLGATLERPAVSCGEENLLNLAGDPYATENILIHELGHTVLEIGLATLDPTFDRRVRDAYQHARTTGRWAGTYAMENYREYWAEATQSWFDANRENDSEHGPISTRARLVPYDPELAALLAEAYGDGAWRYRKVRDRDASELGHLAGFDPKTAGRFEWPARVEPTSATLIALDPHTTPASPRAGAPPTTLVFANHRAHDVVVEWARFDGGFTAYATLSPGRERTQPTYVGHVWRVVESGAELGHVVAVDHGARVDIR
jgi:von Hippel-Lindau disease tumor suppressor protein